MTCRRRWARSPPPGPTIELLAPGRLASLAVERARALVAAGLFTEADRELAYAAEQAAAQRLSHTYADAVQVRAEAALLAGRAEAAAQWARDARARFLGRDNARRAALASLLELRADLGGSRRQPEPSGAACDRRPAARPWPGGSACWGCRKTPGWPAWWRPAR